MLKLENINKTFNLGEEKIKAIDNVNLYVEKGEYISIIGPSGSGKSTLMNIIGLLDIPDSGSYILDDIEINNAKEKELAKIRNVKIGFIFQNFNLLSKLNAIENIEVPLIYRGDTKEEARKIAIEQLKKVGLENRARHLPNQLSRGTTTKSSNS